MGCGRIGAAARGSQGVIHPPTPDGWPRLGTGAVSLLNGTRNVHYRELNACCSTRSLDIMPLDYNSAVPTWESVLVVKCDRCMRPSAWLSSRLAAGWLHSGLSIAGMQWQCVKMEHHCRHGTFAYFLDVHTMNESHEAIVTHRKGKKSQSVTHWGKVSIQLLQLVTSCLELADRIRPSALYPGTPRTAVRTPYGVPLLEASLPPGDARATCTFSK